eukprot:m51a1_g13412 hypothetical protein (153) ;mRNA; f:153-745
MKRIPQALKRRAMEDAQAIRDGVSLSLPRTPSVHEILQRYTSYVTADSAAILGLEHLFNIAATRVLLYRPERLQYAGMRSDASMQEMQRIEASRLYGVEHLVRLCIWITQNMTKFKEDLDPATAGSIAAVVGDLLDFINERSAEFYENQTHD